MALALLLFAGSTLAFWGFRLTSPAGMRPDLWRLIVWLELPALLLLVLAFESLFLDRPRPAWRSGALVGATVGVLVLLFTLLQWPQLWAKRLQIEGLPAFWSFSLNRAYGLLSYAFDGLAVVAAGVVASDGSRASLERKQAAAIGIAFAGLAGHSGSQSLLGLIFGITAGTLDVALTRVAMLSGLAAVVYVGPKLARVYEGRGRRLAYAALGAPLIGGFLDTSRQTIFPALDLVFPFDYRNTRPFWLALFALAFSLAIIRYGLGGFGRDSRRWMARAGSLVLLTGGGVLGAWWLSTPAVGGYRAKVGVGLLLAVGLAAAYRPTRALQGQLIARLVSNRGDPDVLETRRRAYKAALSSTQAAGDGGRRDDRLLERLRSELGLTVHDHLLLQAELDAENEHGPPEELLLGRYTVESPLETSPTGSTYVARDVRTARRVVVKRLHAPSEGAGFDARLLDRWKRVDDENVRALVRGEPVEQGWILVLEHVEGRTLDARLRDSGRLAPEGAVRCALQVLDGLNALHDAGIVHGDLKAENVLVPDDGPVKIVDLGSAVLADRDPTETQPIRTTRGTLAAMAPEEVDGAVPTPASDVYAAGALVHRLLADRHYLPFDAMDVSTARVHVRRKPPDVDAPGIPPDLVPVLERALAKDPSQRFDSALAFAAALQESVNGSGPLPASQASNWGLGDLEHQS